MLSFQSLYRGKQAKVHFKAIKAAVVSIQAAYRGKKKRQLYRLYAATATRIQSQWRCFATRVKFFVFLADVVMVQSIVRRHQAGKFAAMKLTLILRLQKLARKWIASRYVSILRFKKAKETYASAAIQAIYRARCARQSFQTKRCCAIILQKAFRRTIARGKFKSIKSRVIVVQSFARQRLAVIQFAKRKASVLVVQLAVRRMIAKGIVRHLQTQNLALLLQRHSRGFLERKAMRYFHTRATVIQSAFRTHYRRLCYEMDLMDLVLAQSVVRRWLVGKSLVMKALAAVKIQKLFRRKRATILSSLLRFENYCKQKEIHSAILIQSYWRGYVSRTVSQQHSAARKIQKTWRCFITHVDFLIQVMSVIKIQSKVRQLLALQAIEVEKLAVMRLQAAIVIQKWVRGHLCRVDLNLANFAASDIQRIWRGYTCYIDFALKSIAIVFIQAQARRFLATRRQETLKLEAWAERRYLHRQASVIQDCFRFFMHTKKREQSAIKIQAHIKAFLLQQRARKLRLGIIRFQAQTRAIAVRRQRPRKIVALARRVSYANDKSAKDPKMRLGCRTRHALATLRKSNSLTEIMAAVKTLEAATRLSYVCCEVFTGVNAAHALLNLIESCNRSVPHVQLVLSTLLTLDNVARYPRLLPSFADCGAAEIFQDKMQMFRDNDNIFCLSVSLLRCIVECNPAVKVRKRTLVKVEDFHALSILTSFNVFIGAVCCT